MRNGAGSYFTVEFTHAIADFLFPFWNLAQHLAQLLLQLLDILFDALALLLGQFFKVLLVEDLSLAHRCQCKTGRCMNKGDLFLLGIGLDLFQCLFPLLAEFLLDSL